MARAKFLEPSEKFLAALDGFMTAVRKMSDEHHSDPIYSAEGGLSKPTFDAELGGRYVKVLRRACASLAVYCFIDIGTGDILKAASFKAPAKHSRGSIYSDDNGLSAVGPYGARYL